MNISGSTILVLSLNEIANLPFSFSPIVFCYLLGRFFHSIDIIPIASVEIMNLAPIAPAEADFNDTADVTIDVNAMAPVLPLTADFE